MTNRACDEVQEAMELLFEPEGGGEPQGQVLEHLEHCEACAQAYAFMVRLRGEAEPWEPSDAEFLALRRGVLRDIRRTRTPVRRLWTHLGQLVRRPAFALSFSVVLACAGFLLGRRSGGEPGYQAAGAEPMVAQIKQAARSNQGLQDPGKAPYAFENVMMDLGDRGQVVLNLDISRHVLLSLPKEDPFVTEVLLQTLASPSAVGAKLQAIACAGNALEPRIRDVLIKVMLTDANLGVRLKAQAKLIEQDGDPEVQEALLRVLQNGEPVPMKLVAIEYLTRRKVDPGLLQRALAPGGRPDAAYIQARNYVNEHGGRL